MPRNLDTRVELLAPVEPESLRAQLEDTIERCLADDIFGWELGPDNAWTRRSSGTTAVHHELMKLALERADSAE